MQYTGDYMFRKKRVQTAESKPENLIVTQKDSSLQVDLENGHYLKIGAAQNQGKRPYQEDSYGFSNLSDSHLIESKGVLAVLADGMGGLSNGKEVSSMAVSGMIEYFNRPESVCSCGAHIFNYVNTVNNAVCSRFNPDGSIRAGSTIVCALINKGMLHWSCAGDSRLYLKRWNHIYQINEDHDYLNKLLGEAIDDGTDFESAFTDKQKDSLVSCIGSSELSGDTSISGIYLLPGDKIMLCSDGIYNALPITAINAFLQQPAQSAADTIEFAVLANGFSTQDNLTIIIISYE